MKKRDLPLNVQKLDRGSGKLYNKLKELGEEWRNPKTLSSRRKQIERIYSRCLKDWDKLQKNMAKLGIHIGTLG